MSAKHTPGPWSWDDCYESSQGEYTWSLVGSNGYGILSCDGIGNSPQGLGDHANARLIAAAPDLLEAVQAVISDSHGLGHVDPVTLDLCSAAIARATGEQP